MGNNLCRERIARADNSKNPIDRIIGRCAQICPSNEVKSNYWQKHVLETGPPTRAQPQSALNDGWRKVTLTVPNGKISHENGMGETPIAPPRRKRSSIADRQPCGFKELFGNNVNVSRRSSCDSILKDDNQLSEKEREILSQKRKSKSISDFNLNEIRSATDGLTISTIRIPVTRTLSMMEGAMVQQTPNPVSRSTLQRKVSKVGNKKSDKFFGENLSDCLSDDPITPEPEPTSISFTYHTISTLITPIPHTTAESKDKLDEFVNSTVPPNAIDANKSGDAEVINATASITKPFIISDRVDAKQVIGDDKKSSLDKKAEFLMAMLEGNAPYKPVDEMVVMTPPRRSHLKKRSSQQSSSNEMIGNGMDALNNEEIAVEKKTVSNKEVAVNVNSINDDDYYKGMNAVVEPPIVPRKRSIKHICDDDHHLQKHIGHNHHSPNHNENKENEPSKSIKDEDIEKFIIKQVVNSPEKPKRDFSVYEKTNQNVIEKSTPITPTHGDSKVIKQLPRVRHLSQENLMSKKLVSSKSNDTIDLLRIKSLEKTENTINTNKVNGSGGSGNRLESILKKYGSQQSFFTQELLSQIADRVYGFQDPFDTLGHGDDGSSKCTPNSKLTTRKISAHRKESTVTRPIFENVENEMDVPPPAPAPPVDNTPKIVQANAKEQQAINSTLNTNNTEKVADVKLITAEKIMNGNNILDENLSLSTNDPIEQIKYNTENFLTIERNGSMVCDKIQPNQNGFDAKTEPDRIMACAVAANNILDDIYQVNSTILNEFQKNFNGTAATDGKTETINSSDDENTGSDITVKEVPVIEPTKLIVDNQSLRIPKFANGSEKRGSIVEVDAWFLRHNDLSNYSKSTRRGSESNTGYDTRKVFPFGKSDPGAGSEFFDSKALSKSAEHIVNPNVSPVQITSQPNENANANETPSTDHSILLKYLK